MASTKTTSKAVEKIIARVAKEGDAALAFYSEKFDKTPLKPSEFFLGKREIEAGFRRTSAEIRKALQTAKTRIEKFHKEEYKRLNLNWTVDLGGILAGQTARPIEKAALYVPGGRFCYPSTVLMTALPAKAAGVDEIILASPKKNLKDEVLAAAFVAGVDRILCLGGPWAIAALALGTKTVPKVDKIVGPGNQFVTEAKRQVYGLVGIDGLAGPSEIAVWADAKSDVSKVALNLLAQAEHDPDSQSFLLAREKITLANIRKAIPQEFLKQIAFIHLSSEESIAKKINEIAPEHLYLALSNPKRVLKLIRNAGAIFIGQDAPVPLGDYSAGPSHVLPTGSSARFGSGLSVKDFLKWSSTIERKPGKGNDAMQAAQVIADVEGLRFHAQALEISK